MTITWAKNLREISGPKTISKKWIVICNSNYQNLFHDFSEAAVHMHSGNFSIFLGKHDVGFCSLPFCNMENFK